MPEAIHLLSPLTTGGWLVALSSCTFACSGTTGGPESNVSVERPPNQVEEQSIVKTDVPENSREAGAPSGGPVKTRFFKELTLADGEIVVMDGGMHGVQGHSLRFVPTGPAKWTRSLDSVYPSGAAGSGEVVLTSTQTDDLQALSTAAWDAAAAGPIKSFGPIGSAPRPPQWVWVVAIRQGDETRSLQGGAQTLFGGDPPPSAAALLRWTHQFVDAQMADSKGSTPPAGG